MHPAHRHGIVGDDEVTRLGLLRHGVEQVTEAFDIGVVQWRVDFVKHANGRRVR